MAGHTALKGRKKATWLPLLRGLARKGLIGMETIKGLTSEKEATKFIELNTELVTGVISKHFKKGEGK